MMGNEVCINPPTLCDGYNFSFEPRLKLQTTEDLK